MTIRKNLIQALMIEVKGCVHVYTWKDMIYEVLINTEKPLSVKEILKIAYENKLDEKLQSCGKTPDNELGAILYGSTKNDPNSPYDRVGKRPVKFYLKSHEMNLNSFNNI